MLLLIKHAKSQFNSHNVRLWFYSFFPRCMRIGPEDDSDKVISKLFIIFLLITLIVITKSKDSLSWQHYIPKIKCRWLWHAYYATVVWPDVSDSFNWFINAEFSFHFYYMARKRNWKEHLEALRAHIKIVFHWRVKTGAQLNYILTNQAKVNQKLFIYMQIRNPFIIQVFNYTNA